jgi:argininosuccinate synthase
MPDVKVIAPWREWDLLSRDKLLAYADQHGIPVDYKKRKGEAPYSMDANLLHISFEGGVLEDPSRAPAEDMWRLTVSPEKAPARPEFVEIDFERGDPVAINGVKMGAAALLTELNRLGGKHGVGRLDLVENRYVGMKSRGCYETPGGTILLRAHRAIESLTLDREVAHLKDDLMPRYASLVYNGYWWSPERLTLQVLIDHTQKDVNGRVILKLFKGNVIVTSRSSAYSLFDTKIATFDDDGGAYNQADAGGFIKLNALRMRIAGVKAAARASAAKPAARAASARAPAAPAPAAKAPAAKKPAAAQPAARKPPAGKAR